jgi:lipoprotein-anchoring transpeptidase ErfK/SrfK
VNIAGGPNNPVGAVWIALSADTYGIHGAPQPQLVSKAASHGCVRLTNWDAVELGRAARAGVPVRFESGTGLAQRSQRAG